MKAVSGQFTQKGFGLLQIRRVKSFCKPAIHRREQLVGVLALVLGLPQAGGAKMPQGCVGGCALEGAALKCLFVLSVQMADGNRVFDLPMFGLLDRYDPVVYRSAQAKLDP